MQKQMAQITLLTCLVALPLFAAGPTAELVDESSPVDVALRAGEVTEGGEATAPATVELLANDTTPTIDAEQCAATDAGQGLFDTSAAGHCPFGAPRCFKDDHCDSYCGDPRFGVCFSNNCCGCSG